MPVHRSTRQEAERRLGAHRESGLISLFLTVDVNLGAIRTGQERPGDDAGGAHTETEM
jgi:hypothetical protein